MKKPSKPKKPSKVEKPQEYYDSKTYKIPLENFEEFNVGSFLAVSLGLNREEVNISLIDIDIDVNYSYYGGQKNFSNLTYTLNKRHKNLYFNTENEEYSIYLEKLNEYENKLKEYAEKLKKYEAWNRENKREKHQKMIDEAKKFLEENGEL